MAGQTIAANVFRYNPSQDNEPYYQTYEINTSEPMSVQALIRYIYANLDRTLAFRNYNCYIGVCTCCAVKIDEKRLRSCCALVYPGSTITIEPANKEKVIRDLVTVF